MKGAGPASLVLALLGAIVLAGAPAASRQESAGFRPLFDGRTLNGWSVENTDAGNFAVEGGHLQVTGPGGWLRSTERFSDFDLRVEFRFLTADADSGIFLRAPDPPENVFVRGWPANAYQVQVRDISVNRTMKPIWIGDLYRHRVAEPGETRYDADAAVKAFRTTGEWQVIEIGAAGPALSVALNGTPVTTALNIVNPAGHIGIQGETGRLEYRTIAIRERKGGR